MWLILAFISAALLGFYDVAKKQALRQNAVPNILLLNTLLSSLIFLPVIISGEFSLGWFSGTIFDIDSASPRAHLLIFIKSLIVLSSWAFGYMGIKHLPITLVGPINATRPVIVLLGAMLLFSERLNALQWTGVALALVSIFLLSRAGKKEGIDFKNNRWILCVVAAALLGAASGLYDRYIMRELPPLMVQGWFNIYQAAIMAIIVTVIALHQGKNATPVKWTWAIPMISILLSGADLAYFVALSNEDSMLAIVSMIRRSSVVVSFACGAVVFHEKNLRAKAIDMAFILIGMIFLWLGSQ
ncbi:MAG: EamA family transporter [Alistipes sp.]|nr:EamA family transporter [Alistipes sp.]